MHDPRKPLPEPIASLLPMQGHIFEGKYRILRPIGVGGFARVYHAKFEDVERDVALKILVPQTADPSRMYDEELVQRFLREARAVSDLRSVNTITLHDFGRTSRGLLYMVFEFVDGTPLDRLIKNEGPLHPARVIDITEQILQSLREAHAVGLLHRDIKPANVMVFDYLDHRDQVRLLDFGIAKMWTHSADGTPILDDLTEDGTVMGTPRYMSPEQIVGQQLSPQSDIYSLGLLVYEMLVGVPAAPEKVKSEVARRHLGPEPFVLPAQFNFPEGVHYFVGRLLAKNQQQRYRAVDEVLADVAQVKPLVAQLPTWNPTVSEDPTPVTGQDQGGPSQGWGSPTPAQTPMGAAQPWSGQQQQGFTQQPQQMPPQQMPPQQISPPQTSQQQAPQPAGAPPQTFIQMREEGATFEISVPMRPNKRSLIVAAATAVIFMIGFIVGVLTMMITGVIFAWGLSLVFTTYRLRLSPQDGYEVTTAVFTWERYKRGPWQSILRLEARGADADDNTVLKLVTHEGDFTVANAFTDAENRWVAEQANAWIQRTRQQLPYNG